MRILAALASVFVLFGGAAYAQTPVDCNTNATALAGDPGSSVVVVCPAGCTTGSVWGTGMYSDDSSVCTAAVHAGVLSAAGGTIQVTIQPGQAAYPPSTANGVTTSSWGQWHRSFSVAPAGAAQAVDCTTAANQLSGDPGAMATLTCPAGCTTGSVWGTGIYSDDSSMCTAAVHAGVLTAAGGNITVIIAPGQPNYAGTTANGITSGSWGEWGRSFTVAPAMP